MTGEALAFPLATSTPADTPIQSRPSGAPSTSLDTSFEALPLDYHFSPEDLYKPASPDVPGNRALPFPPALVDEIECEDEAKDGKIS